MEIEIFENKKELARYFGDMLVDMARSKERVYIALSGGSTPKVIFDILAEEYRQKIDWKSLVFFWGDERCVAPDDAESNYGMTKRHLFSKLPIENSNIFRVKGEMEAELAAADYSAIIDGEVPKENGTARFDLMILGMGDDGHTASIFPHQIDLWQSDSLCEVATHPESGQKRITLTGKVINNSARVVFLVTGSSKAEKVDEIINSKGSFKKYPAALVAPDNLLWMLDKEAASSL